MKALLAIFTIVMSLSVFAKDCEKEVEVQFIKLTEDYDYHVVSNKPVLHVAGTEGFESYGRYVELDYDIDVLTYHASNEMWGGYGAYQLVVNPKTCEIIKMQEVYTE